MTEVLIGVYGASGFGREVIPLVSKQYKVEGVDIVFVDDGKVPARLNGYEVLGYDEFLNRDVPDKRMVFAIADGGIREKLVYKCENDRISRIPVQAGNVVILDDVEVGEGSILCHFSQLTSNIRIGKHFHANIYSYVAHDCVIGDYVTFAPAVRCNGNIIIEDHVYIGTGAVIKQGTPENPLVIGKGSIVGMGAVVTRNVPPGATVVGNPARKLDTKKN